MKNYIIGYGSLMNLSSLNRTLPTIDYIEPIYLTGFKRSWNALEKQNKSLAPTYLGIEKQINSRMNCIVFALSQEALTAMDQREFLYTRELVDASYIETLKESKISFNKEDKIWIFVTQKPSIPNNTHPIIQSYVDTCLSGCFDLELKFDIKDFALDFIKSTDNWSENWVNDRIYPRSPHIYQPYAFKIDDLLHTTMPKLFKGICIE